MTPSYVTSSSFFNNASATYRSPTLPTYSTGDFLIAVVGVKHNESHSVSGTGWTKYTQVNSGTGWTVSISVCYADGSEGTPTISWSTAAACFAQVHVYRGTSSSPIGAVGSNTGSTSTHSVTGITTTRANSRVIYIGAAAANTAYGTPSGWTEDRDLGGGATRCAVGSKSVATQGTGAGDISITAAAAAWVLWQIELREPVTNLTAAAGSFSITGNAAAFTRAFALTAGAGSFAVTGNAAALARSLRLSAAAGSFAITGNAAAFAKAFTLTAGAGSFAVTGNAAALSRSLRLTAEAGSYSLTGNVAALLKSSILTAGVGSYAVTGSPAALSRSLRLIAEAGAYSITGNAAALLRSSLLTAGAGTYAVTGNPAALSRSLRLIAEAGAYSITGNAADLLKSSVLDADAGAFTVTGNDATLTYNSPTGYTLTAEAGTYSITGHAAALVKSSVLDADAGSFAVSGSEAALARNLRMAAGVGAYSITGNAAGLLKSSKLTAGVGSFTVTGSDATLTYTSIGGVIEIDATVVTETSVDSVLSQTEFETDGVVFLVCSGSGAVQLEADAESAVRLVYEVSSEALS